MFNYINCNKVNNICKVDKIKTYKFSQDGFNKCRMDIMSNKIGKWVDIGIWCVIGGLGVVGIISKIGMIKIVGCSATGKIVKMIVG